MGKVVLSVIIGIIILGLIGFSENAFAEKKSVFNVISDAIKYPFHSAAKAVGWDGTPSKFSGQSEPQSKEEALRLSLLPLLKEKICSPLNDKLDEINQQEKRYQQIQRELGVSANELFGMDVIGGTTELKNQIVEIMKSIDCKKNNSVFNFFSWWN